MKRIEASRVLCYTRSILGNGSEKMIRDIMKDTLFLQIPSQPATVEDVSVGEDLLETLQAHKEGCVGMAANMIGVSKRVIAFVGEKDYEVLYNPKIVSQSQPYQTEEGCLSLEGVRPTKRFGKIKVEFQNESFQTRFRTYTGWVAQIVQHEIDHCDGIII